MLCWLQLGRHPKLTGALAATAAAAGVYYWRLSSKKAALERAATLQRSIRVLKQRDPRLLARLLSHLFTSSVSWPHVSAAPSCNRQWHLCT